MEDALNSSVVIAIIDDDQPLREALNNLLRSHGHLVWLFPSAEAFLDAGLWGRADVLITDIQMPGMNGLELISEIRYRGNAIPIIAITAHHSELVARDAIKRGAIACLFKPFDEDILLSAIEKALRGSRAA